MASNIKFGKPVEYRDSNGYIKLGFVTGTAETVVEGSGVPVPGPDQAHLFVVSPTGNTYHRESVPLGEGPSTFSQLGKAKGQ